MRGAKNCLGERVSGLLFQRRLVAKGPSLDYRTPKKPDAPSALEHPDDSVEVWQRGTKTAVNLVAICPILPKKDMLTGNIVELPRIAKRHNPRPFAALHNVKYPPYIAPLTSYATRLRGSVDGIGICGEICGIYGMSN